MILFRVDSGTLIGSGHVGRCLNLALAFKDLGHDVAFASRPYKGHCLHLIQNAGVRLYILPVRHEEKISLDPSTWLCDDTDFDIESLRSALGPDLKSLKFLVIDHYAIAHDWEKSFSQNIPILALDDLGSHEHQCDLILHQNVETEILEKIRILNPSIPVWSGPENILLSKEILKLSRKSRSENSSAPNRIMVFFGGGDPEKTTIRVGQLLKNCGLPFQHATVITGTTPGRLEEAQAALGDDSRFEIVPFAKDFASRLQQCELFIGGGGSSAYERGLLGIPSITITIAENQIPFATRLGKLGITIYLGPDTKTTDAQIIHELMELWDKPRLSVGMSRQGRMTFINCKGAPDIANRLIQFFQEKCMN